MTTPELRNSLPINHITMCHSLSCENLTNQVHRLLTNSHLIFLCCSCYENKRLFLDRSDTSREKNKARAKVLAHLISMPVQLKHLIVENFEWLLHVVQYVSIMILVHHLV